MTDPTRAEQVAHDLIYNKLWNKEHNSWVKVSDAVQIIATALRAEGDRVAREGAEIAKSHRAGDSAYMWKACGGEIATALLASRGLG